MYPPVFENEEKKVLERFVIIMYDRSSSATDIDSVRLDINCLVASIPIQMGSIFPFDELLSDWTGLDMFARKQKSYDAIPQPMLLWNIT